ncbi:MAG: hypothetical protein Q9209_002505 [Squamulea sp. 1 TL-2023]
MPVTIKPASHDAKSINAGSHVEDPLELLKHACPEESKGCQELLQSSYGSKIHSAVNASRNGRYLIGEVIAKHVVDPKLRRWMIPAFTTTTEHDIIVAFILLMGSCQEYFEYTCGIVCCLPSVTLVGDRADWVLILARLEKLKQYGQEPTQFYFLLKPVLSRFVKSFDNPTDKETISFWNRIVSQFDEGSGPTYYSGWITAFCFWNNDGKSMYNPDGYRPGGEKSALRLDDATYHVINSDTVPPGYTSVPVKLDDNGEILKARMVAGSLAQTFTSSRDEGSSLDTIQPESSWWMFVE